MDRDVTNCSFWEVWDDNNCPENAIVCGFGAVPTELPCFVSLLRMHSLRYSPGYRYANLVVDMVGA